MEDDHPRCTNYQSTNYHSNQAGVPLQAPKLNKKAGNNKMTSTDSKGKEKHNCILGASEKNKYLDSIEYQLVGDKYRSLLAAMHYIVHQRLADSPTLLPTTSF
jgi:hypothetical protein